MKRSIQNKCQPHRFARGFTMVEIMIVVTIMGIIVAIAHSTWLRQRELARSRSCQENLAKIDGAKEQYALDNNLGHGGAIAGGLDDLVGNTEYLKREPECPASGKYSIGAVGTDPVCSYTPPEWAPQHQIQGEALASAQEVRD